MRIISFRVIPIARVLSIVYGAFGLTYVPTLLLFGVKQMILPVGIVAPLVFLNLNLRFASPTHFATGVLSSLGATLYYGLDGMVDRGSRRFDV
ncbi:MAG: hypothetical protein WBM24_23790 [Candidatus Sulfotelmatobacter sp.]